LLSRDYLLLRASLVGSQAHSIHQFPAFGSHFQLTSSQMASLLSHFRSPEVTWRHLLSRDCLSCKLQPCRKLNAQYTPVFGLLQPLPGDFRSDDVLSGHLSWRDVISCYVTASSCELQPGWKSNAQHMAVFNLLQPLPGNLQSNDVTSGSLLLTWGYVMSFPVTWLSPLATYSLVGSQTHRIRKYSAFSATSRWLPVKWHHLRVTSPHLTSRTSFPVTWLPPPASYSLVGRQTHRIPSFRPSTATLGDFRTNDVTSGHLSSRDVICCDVTASSCKLQPGWKSNAQHMAVSNLLQPLRVDFRSNDVTSDSLPITWSHVTSFLVTWLPPPASYSLVESQTHSIRQFPAFGSHFQLTSGQMTSLPGHFRSPEVKWHHFLSCDYLLLQPTAL